MKGVLRWIAGNLSLMVLAFILSILAWFVAVKKTNPVRTGRFSQPLPVTIANLADGMMILGRFDEDVEVTVHAPESLWAVLEIGDFSATVDLTGYERGRHEIPVQVTLDKEPAEVTSIKPEFIELELELSVEEIVPVRVEVEGRPTVGYLVRSLTSAPNQVTVSGPATYVYQVIEAVTSVSVQDAGASIERELSLQPLDGEGNSVPHVVLDPDVTVVRIPIELSGHYRPVTIKAVLEGQIAPGYRIRQISVEPPSITVFADPDTIAALPGIIETEPINLEGAQADVIVRPALNTLPDVAVVPGQSPVEVEISIEPIQSSVTMEIVPEIQGMAPGLTVTVSPTTVETILSGSLPLLETLDAKQVRVQLNLYELPVGVHQIEPQMVVPDGVTTQSILPATVQVEIAVVPTVTVSPVATPTQEPTAGE